MAKRKKKPTTKRRRRVSGIGQLDPMALLLAAGGGLGAYFASQELGKSTNTTVQKIAPFVGVAAGIATAALVKHKAALPLSLGLVAGGTVPVLKKLNVLKGIGFMTNVVNGYVPLPMRQTGRQANVVNGANWSGSGLRQTRVISGIPSVSLPLANGSGTPFN